MATYKPPPWFEALVNAPDRPAFDAALRDAEPPKRGRPSKADVNRKSAHAEYMKRMTTGSAPPGGWSTMHPAPSMSVRKERDVGRPYDVDLSAPFDQQFGKKFVERFIGNAAWLLRIKKDKYRKQASDRKYVPARVADAFAEQILSELEPEFLRLAAELGDEFDERFQDQVKALKRRLGYYEDKLYERDELKRLVMMRERNLDQINLDRKRITRAASR